MKMHVRTRRVALIEGATAGVLFGTASIFIRFLDGQDAFFIAFWRVVISCLVLAMTLVVIGKSFSFDVVRKRLRELFVLGFFLALHFIFFTSAVKDTKILNATVLVNTTPIFSMFISSFLFNVKPSRLAIVGLAVSFIGVLTIVCGEMLVMNVNVFSAVFSSSVKGDLEAVLAALVEAFYLNYGRKIRSQMGILSTMFPIYLSTAIVLGISGLPIASKTFTMSLKTEVILPIVALGTLPTALAHTLYFSSLSNLKSFETATMALLEPVGATILGMILFAEVPSLLFVLGAASVLLGISFVIKDKSEAIHSGSAKQIKDYSSTNVPK